VLAANVRRLRSGFLLPQYRDDLLFREPTCLHVHPPAGDGLYPFLAEIAGLRSVDLTKLKELHAADYISVRGVQLMGDGFIVTPQQAAALGLGRVPETENVIKPYLHNRDLKARPRGVMVIDLFGYSENEVRQKFPAIFQWILERVKPVRDTNPRPSYKRLWWIFGEPRAVLRPALVGLHRIIVTGETSHHRFFEFFSTNTIADNMIRIIASDDAYILGVLSSRIHTIFSLRKGGWLGQGNDPRYQAECFSTFPFPSADEKQKQRVRELAEELDALRKRVVAEHDFLTMTKLYNVREKLKSHSPLDESERAVHDTGCVGVIHELHNQIDTAVANMYGWPADLGDEEILGRLVELNKTRADEEKQGSIRWLRPEYQAARAKLGALTEEQVEAELQAPAAAAPELPKDDAALVAELRKTLRVIGRPVEPKDLAQQFQDGVRFSRRVERGLQLLAAAGVVRRSQAGWYLPADRAT
jgi:restriction-modification enzyme MmeI-like protein